MFCYNRHTIFDDCAQHRTDIKHISGKYERTQSDMLWFLTFSIQTELNLQLKHLLNREYDSGFEN